MEDGVTSDCTWGLLWGPGGYRDVLNVGDVLQGRGKGGLRFPVPFDPLTYFVHPRPPLLVTASLLSASVSPHVAFSHEAFTVNELISKV